MGIGDLQLSNKNLTEYCNKLKEELPLNNKINVNYEKCQKIKEF